MSSKKRLVRISCTVPEDVVAAADSLAEAEQRSRSWVVSEAIRRYAGGDAADIQVLEEIKRIREEGPPGTDGV